MTPSRRKTVASYDGLAEMVHAAILMLETAGKIANEGLDTDWAPFNGYCARACAAYVYLAEHVPAAKAICENPPMSLKVLREKGAPYGDSHYWLESEDGQVLDLIFRERRRLKRSIPYDVGKGGSLRRDRHDKQLPARHETQQIIRVVETALS